MSLTEVAQHSPLQRNGTVPFRASGRGALLIGDRRFDVVSGQDAQIVDGEDVRGVDHSDQKRMVVLVGHRDRGVPSRILLCDEVGG